MPRSLSKYLKFSSNLLGLIITALLVGLFFLIGTIVYLDSQLPDVSVLKDIQLQAPMQVYSSDNKLIAVFGEKRRVPVAYEDIPPQLIQAVLATEDQRFFEHSGVDFLGLGRAAVKLLVTGSKSEGGSTITMQVARNFFLTKKKTYSRKFREILLAIKIDNELSKQKILDLYLNKIYLGNRAYGVGAAAEVYYGKKLNELTLPQMAMIAGLPKAPSSINPLANPIAAKNRRDHVLARMLELDYIDEKTYQQAVATPITASYHGTKIEVNAPYIAEMVRQQMVSAFGDNAYTTGLKVYTTVDSKLQQAAQQIVHNNLLAYTKRHGFKKPEQNLGNAALDNLDQWQQQLQKLPIIAGLFPAAVIDVNENSINVLLSHGELAEINWEGLSWASPQLANGYRGPAPKSASDIVKVGDVIHVQLVNNQWQLAPFPEAQSALVSMNPKDGSIVALTGGFSFQQSNFNRATQAQRQAGSIFKPFLYSAALAKNFTLASIINDAPIVISDSGENSLWRPQNDTKRFYGPTRLREGLIKSRNLVSIRLLQDITIPYARTYISRFGFNKDALPSALSLALGTALVTPLDIATGYSVFANGGYKVQPYLISRIENESGETLYQNKPKLACEACITNPQAVQENMAPQVITSQNAYLMTIVLQDVIAHGTARKARELNRDDMAGKTGTTNEQNDAWFSGFNSDLVTTVWIGFDQPNSLYEYGAEAALPIWVDFMKVALAGKPSHTMPEPAGIVSIRINAKTGLPAGYGDKNAFFEKFQKGNAPTPADANSNHDAGESGNSNEDYQQIF